MPEGGQSAVTIWGSRAFTTTHRPIREDDSRKEPNLVGYCLDSNPGEILWQVDLPGSDPVEMGGIFSDASVFAPVTDGEHVWFFNRCGSVSCFNFAGERVWIREFHPRARHTNRQCEPILIGDVLLAINDLGSAGGPWNLSQFTSANGRLYVHTMKEVICIGGLRQGQAFGESSRSIHSDTLGLRTKVPTPGQTVPAMTTDDVAFSTDHVPRLKIVNIGTNFQNAANEFMTNHHWNGYRALSPSVPIVDMQIGAADPRPVDVDHDIIDANLWLRNILQLETRCVLRFHQCLHPI